MDDSYCVSETDRTRLCTGIVDVDLSPQIHSETCRRSGYPRLSTVTKPYIQKFLKEQDMKPFKIKYYCEKRDPDFESKMHEVLLVYKQIEMQFDENGDLIVPDDYKLTITVSYDEKPGIQAISNTAPDLRPTSEHGEVYRDAEYKRLGTLSLLAGIDLLTGEAIPLVSETHKSSDFIEFLKILDKKYPSQDTIRIILIIILHILPKKHGAFWILCQRDVLNLCLHQNMAHG